MITLSHEGNSRIEIKQSVFIGHSARIQSAEEAQDFIKQEKALYPDAKHCCYAWTISQPNLMQKTSDDGEPSGTAGMPLLTLLTKNDITSTVVLVTRYLGGIMLGKGGLVRAYTAAGAQALSDAEPVVVSKGIQYTFQIEYSLYDTFLRQMSERGWEVRNSVFETSVKADAIVPEGEEAAFCKFFGDMTSGSKHLEKTGECELCGEKLILF